MTNDTTVKDSFIPLFNGEPSEYKEWRKRILIYHKKMQLTKRGGESILNLIGSLQGAAWRLLEDFNLDEAEKPDAMDRILKVLDSHFEYDQRVQLPSDFDGYFSLHRRQNQTLLSYVSDHTEQYRKLEKHKMSLPSAVQGWHLLRQSGLSREQRQLITLKAPQREVSKVIEAMYLILGQDYKGHSSAASGDRRWQRSGKGHRAYAAEEDYGEEENYDEDDGYAESIYYGGEEWNDSGYDPTLNGTQDFDNDAVYYQDDAAEADDAPADFDVEQFDQAYAAYLDARKRFTDLKLARGFLPVVALSDPAAGNLTPGTSSPTRSSGGYSPSKGGKKGKGKKGGKPNVVRYNKPPMKPSQPQQRAQSAMKCLRCGQPGHFAVDCPVSARSKNQGTKRAAPTESMASHNNKNKEEHVMVTFQDRQGHERLDVALLDPGASAFLCGVGPMFRYIDHLRELGYPVDTILIYKSDRTFHFGGDASSVAKWVVRMPMFVNGNFGFGQVFVVPGETPMLCGRPIIQALGISINFSGEQIKFGDGVWQPALLGLHGEYLLPLCSSFESWRLNMEPHFDLQLAAPGEVDLNPMTLAEATSTEKAFITYAPILEEPLEVGTMKLKTHLLTTMDVQLTEQLTEYNSYITAELHDKPKRVIWEVYGGKSRLSEIAESLGASVEVFSRETGWDFDIAEHRRCLLQRQNLECPDEVFISPTCGPWSVMQNLAAQTDEQRLHLQQAREYHHAVHLQFAKQMYLQQIKQSAHAHLEQPLHALSWKTTALKALPGLFAQFDQCCYGAQCQDTDFEWRPVKKSTGIRTTKRALYDAFQLRCPGDHDHCHLEGSGPDVGRRTKYMEHYQPCMAASLAGALMIEEVPTWWEFAGAASDEKLHAGALEKLLTENRQEAVRLVQRLHRNLGHPNPETLAGLLEARGASNVVIDIAKQYQCVSCQRYRKPNTVAPAALSKATEFNQRIQADVVWFKIDKLKVPVLSIVDEATKYQAAMVIYGERSTDFKHALERAWIRHFGPPATLVTDEGRGWASDDFSTWTSDLMISHEIAPGEAHTRLSMVERRNAILRKAAEIYMHDLELQSADGLRQALAHVVPQLNAAPSVSGFSPAQWLLGHQPRLPGELLSDSLAPSHLGSNSSFEENLARRAIAKKAIIEAETDRKLRRALLRKYRGLNVPLTPGQLCYYWRDARQPDLRKIRWCGPARVI